VVPFSTDDEPPSTRPVTKLDGGATLHQRESNSLRAPHPGGIKRSASLLPPPVVPFSTDDEPPSTRLVAKPDGGAALHQRESNSLRAPHPGGIKRSASLLPPVPFFTSIRRKSTSGYAAHEQNESSPKPGPSRAPIGQVKPHVQCQPAPSFNAMLT
jgi:hypothetical protein